MSSYQSKNRRRPIKAAASLPIINPHAAGIDVGSTQMYICVPPDSCAEPIGIFDVFTEDLLEAIAWLKKCSVRTVAMEATGVYWIAFYQLLEDHGFDVLLVNPGYRRSYDFKSDIEDCQKLQYLHAVGLLSGSFRPPQQVCAVRSIIRHRSTLVRQASSHVLRMQKSLTQMNLLLDNVISDITGVTGLAIIDAILAGERSPQKLSLFRDRRIKATAEEIAKSLVGDYRSEHLFTLKQSREALRFCQSQMAECDAQIATMLAGFDSKSDIPRAPKNGGRKPKPRKNDIVLPQGDLRDEMYRINGVDLTAVPGLGASSVHTLFCEFGADLSKFASNAHFASWIALCPQNRISGGKVLAKGTRKIKSRAAATLRMAAQCVARSKCYLGNFYRRIKARLGPAAANTATAHKIARIIYHMLTTKEPYDESVFKQVEEKFQQKRVRRLQKEAAELGYTFQPA
jgi:transposase